MDPKIIIAIGLASLALLLGVATIWSSRKKMEEMVYILGVLTLIVLVGVIAIGIILNIWWIWVFAILFILIWALYLGIHESIHHDARMQRTHK